MGTQVKHAALAVVVATPFLCACAVDIRRDGDGRATDVSIRSLAGHVSVQANRETPPDTGLTVHPGARLSTSREHQSANVDVEAAGFGVAVAVATFEDDQPPQALVDYYRHDLARYGAVAVCHGDVQFTRRGGGGPVCQQPGAGRETQLVAGTERNHRIVAITPRGEGSEFTLLYVRAGD